MKKLIILGLLLIILITPVYAFESSTIWVVTKNWEKSPEQTIIHQRGFTHLNNAVKTPLVIDRSEWTIGKTHLNNAIKRKDIVISDKSIGLRHYNNAVKHSTLLIQPRTNYCRAIGSNVRCN